MWKEITPFYGHYFGERLFVIDGGYFLFNRYAIEGPEENNEDVKNTRGPLHVKGNRYSYYWNLHELDEK